MLRQLAFSLTIASLTLALSLAAQTTETIDVRVMEIDAVVVDRKGNLVNGLTRDDFEVYVGGKRRQPSNFYAVRESLVVTEQDGSGVEQPVTAIPTSLVIFIDENRLRQGSKNRSLDALQRYVREHVGPLTSAMIVTYHRVLDVRVRPTDRPGYLLTELDKIKSEPFAGHANDTNRVDLIRKIDEILASAECAGRCERRMDLSPDFVWHELERYAERETQEVDHTLKALREAVKLASGFSGRKVLLYVSEGLPQLPAADLLEYWDRLSQKSVHFSDFSRNMLYGSRQIARYDRTRQFQQLADDAQRANVAFFSFAAAGVRGFEGTGPEMGTHPQRPDTFLSGVSRDGGAQMIAEQTGGRFMRNENDIDRVLEAMSEQFSTYYSIGIDGKSGKSMDVKVKIKNRPDLRVITARHRTPLSAEEQLAQNVRSRLYSQQAENPLAANLFVGKAAPIGTRCVATVRIDVPRPIGNNLGIHFALLNAKNDESGVRSAVVAVDKTPMSHSFTLGLQPEKHVLSLAIADGGTGETSYLQKEIDGSGCR